MFLVWYTSDVMRGKIDVIIGAQMGDEGKGRFTNLLAGEGYAIVGRFNGGANAGHTFEHRGREINTHQIPSGITYQGVANLITNSSLVDPTALVKEIRELEHVGIDISPRNLAISAAATLVLPIHIHKDEQRENGDGAQGSTKRGIRFVAGDKYRRDGLTAEKFYSDPRGIGEVLLEQVEHEFDEDTRWELSSDYNDWVKAMYYLEDYFTDTVELVHQRLEAGSDILAEGAQSSGLDIEHGIHGEGTSSHVTVGGVLNSFGVGPQYINNVYGVAKLLKSRVGGTPDSFPTRIDTPDLAQRIRGTEGAIDAEYGKSTGRARMVGWLDLAELRQTKRVNGLTDLIVTKLDCLPRAGDTVKVATHYIDRDRKKVLYTPTSLDRLKDLTPVYQEFPTWEEDIQHVRKFDDLPGPAQEYLNFISMLVDLPVSMIGVGPNKDQIIDNR